MMHIVNAKPKKGKARDFPMTPSQKSLIASRTDVEFTHCGGPCIVSYLTFNLIFFFFSKTLTVGSTSVPFALSGI